MSKQIKQMEMDALKATFQEVRDLVLLSTTGLDCQADHQMRTALRKKSIRLQVVKNSLARRVFDELGIQAATPWAGPTTVAWGAGSLAELSREVEALARKNPKIQPKWAFAEGQEVTFKQALAMPTRAEAIGRVVSLALDPASRLVGQILGPARQVAAQIKTVSEKAPPAEDTPPPEGPPPAEGAEPAPAAG